MANLASKDLSTSSEMSSDQRVFPPTRILPVKIQNISDEPGAKVADWFNSLFTVIVALSTLGASVTFSYVVSGIRTPTGSHPTFSTKKYETFMAISWLLFMLDLAVSTLFSTLLTFFKDDAVPDWGSSNLQKRMFIQWSATLATALLYGLTIIAFIFLGLVITAYSAVVGWIAVAFTAAFGLGGFIAIVVQSPAFRKRP